MDEDTARGRRGARDRGRALACAGTEDAVVDEEIDARLRDQDGEFFQELDAAEDERAGAVGPGARERETDATVGQQLETLLGERRPQEVVAEPFERPTIVGSDGWFTTCGFCVMKPMPAANR